MVAARSQSRGEKEHLERRGKGHVAGLRNVENASRGLDSALFFFGTVHVFDTDHVVVALLAYLMLTTFFT